MLVPLFQDDNDDYCASCSGSGDLVCCDGCTRSFHFNCVDPPFHEDRDLPDEWFCNVCIAQRNPASLTRYTGIFGALLNIMEQRNSSAFSLPLETRNYFEGVKTGAEGEYEDIVVTGTSRTRKRGYDEAPDFFRIRDNDGNPVLCHTCNRSAEDNRPIIPCAFCGLWWHIDCLDPPMANPPVLRNWRCPAHADDILAKLPGQLGPAHRFRKIKGAPVIKPAYSRGMINNGFIEFNSDDDSHNHSGWRDWQSFGRVQRIGARGVELDFLQQIRKEQNPTGKQRRARMHRQQERPEFRKDVEVPAPGGVAEAASVQPAAQLEQSDRALLANRQFIDEAQAAQNLSALRTTTATEERPDRSGDLINALLSQADASVISLMAQANPLSIECGSALTQADLTALQAMRAQIDLLLSNPRVVAASPAQPKQEQSAEIQQQDNVPENTQTNTVEAQEVPEITMDDAHAEHDTEQAVPETNEVMSLVSDNGENEDEDPPTITTPLNTSEEGPASAVWPVDQSISDPGSGNGALASSTKADLAESDIDGFRLCDHNNAKGPLSGDSVPEPVPEKTPEAVEITSTAEDDKRDVKHGEEEQPLPLTPVPASSQTAVGDDDKENEKVAGQLDKQSETQDSALESKEAQTETNESADK
ncbi:hypothetical protein Sste5346_003988 [Sporothrix stenoceras]|uniref:PHD-type domain-containing protein n=1 Tax=Sporothrix stenoceras TaxID=5173 RepID=A0ABR3ZBJ5_9PEZI